MKSIEEFKNKVIHNDCLKILKDIPSNSIDLIITDPPYYKIISDEYDNQWKSEEEFIEWQKKWLLECKRILKDSGSLYFFGSIKNNCLLKIKLWLDNEMIFRNWITWDKKSRISSGKKNFKNIREEILYYVKSDKFYFVNPRGLPYRSQVIGGDYIKYLIKNNPPYDKNIIDLINQQYKEIVLKGNWTNKNTNLNVFHIDGRYCGNIISHIRDEHNSRSFGKKIVVARKPISLLEIFIKASSREGDLILDPFAGSGTTGIVCKNLNRNYILIEKEKKFIGIINKQLSINNKLF